MLKALMTAQALKVVYDHGFEIKDENFVELTYDQYAALEHQGADISKPWFRLTRGIFEDRNNPPDEVPIVDESEKNQILEAVQLVHHMTSRADRSFRDFRERLAWLSERLPEAITGKPATAPSEPVTAPSRPTANDDESQRLRSPRAPCRVHGVERVLQAFEALQDKGKAEAAEQLMEFIVFQSELEAQLRAIEVLARHPTPRGLGFLRWIDEPTIGSWEKSEGIRIAYYSHASGPLAQALVHHVDLSGARDDAERREALEKARRDVLAESEAHRVLRAAIRAMEEDGPS